MFPLRQAASPPRDGHGCVGSRHGLPSLCWPAPARSETRVEHSCAIIHLARRTLVRVAASIHARIASIVSRATRRSTRSCVPTAAASASALRKNRARMPSCAIRAGEITISEKRSLSIEAFLYVDRPRPCPYRRSQSWRAVALRARGSIVCS